MKIKSSCTCVALILLVLTTLNSKMFIAFGQGTAFTYQGRLVAGTNAVTGSYDLTFTVFASNTGGIPQTGTVTNIATGTTNGLFSAMIDFGPGAIIGATNWLEIGVRTNGGSNFTTLSPRQQLTPTPFAITAEGVVAGGITSAMLGTGVVSSANIAAGAVKGYDIDDGGNAAYQGFQQMVQAAGGDSSLTFSNLFQVPPTNGVNPGFAFTVNGAGIGTVAGFSGSEGMSQPYAYAVEVSLPNALTSPDTQVGLQGRLTFNRNGRSTSFGGLVTACTLSGADGTNFLYAFRIESPLAYLALTTDYKIYQNRTVPTVASNLYQTVTGYAPTSTLAGSYSTSDNLTQYGETDLNFFSRLLENEGIFYFFNQSVSPPSLVVGDSTSAYLTAPNSPFNYYGNMKTNIPAAEFIGMFQKAVRQSTLSSTVNSYNFQTPTTTLAATNSGTAGLGSYYEFGNEVQSLAYDQQLAQVRQDLHNDGRMAISGAGTAPDMRAGCTFQLNDQSGAGLSGTYLVTSVHHAGFVRVTNGVSTVFYGNKFEVIPSSLNYRPSLVTPAPGAQPCTAIVTGPAGEQIYTDKYGRVKVQFKWDRYGPTNDTSSAWLRVASPVAGPSHGMIFLPRIGDEVLVSFIQGDPNQPVIIGSLYNNTALPPYTLPGNNAVSTIRSTGVKNQPTQVNEIKFDDTAGSQDLALTAAKNLNLSVGNDTTINSTHDIILLASNNLNLTANAAMTIQAGTLTIRGTNQTTISSPLSINGGMNIDQANLNSGTVSANALTFGAGSGEGIGSQRAGSGNLYDLVFYTDFLPRMTILQTGNIGIGTTNPANMLQVGTAYCNGAIWQNGSDRNSKQDFDAINPREVLEKVSALPITEWKFKVEKEGVKHLGPMAQDFHAAFGLNGSDEKHIATVDEEGVALAAIQGLNQKLNEKDAEIQTLKQRLAALEKIVLNKKSD